MIKRYPSGDDQETEEHNQRVGESKKKKENSRSKIGRNMQKGLWTRQYLNNTELSPRKERKTK